MRCAGQPQVKSHAHSIDPGSYKQHNNWIQLRQITQQMPPLPKSVVVVGLEATSSLWQSVFDPEATDLTLMEHVLALNPAVIANTLVTIYRTKEDGTPRYFPGTTSPQGYTTPPLHAAVLHRNLPLVKLLCGPDHLPPYADLNALDRRRHMTALTAAMQVPIQGVKLSQEQWNIAWYLLGRGADINAGIPSAWAYASRHAADGNIRVLYQQMQPLHRGSRDGAGAGH